MTQVKFDAAHDDGDANRFHVEVDGKFSIQIVRTHEGVIVDIYPVDGAESLSSAFAMDSDIPNVEETAHG